MPPLVAKHLLDRIRDRYEVIELIELLNPSMDEVLDAFEDRLLTLIEEGDLDIDDPEVYEAEG
jgi:hypothetical protein